MDNLEFCTLYYCPKCGTLQKHTPLTSIEIEILRQYADGLSTAEIAQMRFISMKTVEHHRRNLMLKTGTPTMIAAVVWGIRNKIVLI